MKIRAHEWVLGSTLLALGWFLVASSSAATARAEAGRKAAAAPTEHVGAPRPHAAEAACELEAREAGDRIEAGFYVLEPHPNS